MKKILKSMLSTLAALTLVITASAQITTSNFAGRVADASGAVAGAAVIAVHTPSGSSYYAITDENGQYRINGITPGGPYTVSVEMLGYRKVSYTGVTAPLAETLVIDATLEDESLSLEGVTITAESNESSMNIRRSGAGTTVSRKTMENIPSVGRSLNDIMALTPQASSTTSGMAIGGGSYRGSTVTVDGAAFNNAFGIGQNLPAGGTPISIDAIEQMSVNITPFDVRQSGFQGGAINAVTKSGSNEFHASVYDYFTNDKLQGHKVGDASVTGESLSNTVGFTVGGPIVKNKLFFFINAEYSSDVVPGSTNKARVTGQEEWGEDVEFNRPTVAQMDDILKFLGDKFNYNPGRYQDYSLSTPDYKILARLDWNINDNNKFNIRFSHTHNYYSSSPSSSMSPIGGTDSSFGNIKFNRYSAGRQSAYTMPFESARYFQEQNFTSLAGELNSRFADGKANNMFRVAWSHQFEPRSYVGNLFPTVDIMSNAEMKEGSDTYGMLTTFGVDPFTYGNLRDVNTVTATDEFTYSTGKHNIIAGAQFEWNRAKNGYMQGGAGWYIYDSWDTFKADVQNPSAATMPAAFMITHANLEDPTAQTFPAFDYSQASLYAQDEISFSDYFKLTAGIRFEMPIITIPTDNENKDFTAIANANPNSSFAGLKTSDLPALRVNVSPRIGFNWDVLKNRNLIVRGGTGLYTGRIPNVWLVSAVGNSNCLQYQYIANDKTGSPKVHFSNDREAIINSIYSSGKFVKQDLAAPTATTVMAKDLKMPTSWKSSLAIDAKLPGGIKATIEGVYSVNYNEVYATQLGYKQEGSVQLPGEPKARNLWASEGIKNMSGSGMNGYYIQNIPGVHGNYYSITAQLSKSFDFGLDLMAAYTRAGSKSLSDGTGDQVSEFANTYCLNGSNEPVLGNAFYVAPNRVIANAQYTIKEGRVTATKLSAFYEGYNIGYISSYSYSRVSYLMNNVSGAGKASQLIYIPTDAELDKMNFVSAENKAAYKDFLATDKYTKKHRGEYSERNGVEAPWLNRINVRIAQDFYFDIAKRQQTIEVSLDIKNLGNLLNSNWGVYKIMSSNTILNYDAKAQQYKFTAPSWGNNAAYASTWQMLLSARWFF